MSWGFTDVIKCILAKLKEFFKRHKNRDDSGKWKDKGQTSMSIKSIKLLKASISKNDSIHVS